MNLFKDNNLPHIVFFADGHTYWKEGRKVNSVGSLLSTVTPPFDKYWETHIAFKEFFGKEYTNHFRKFRSPKPDPQQLYGPFLEKMDDKTFIENIHEIRDRWLLKKTIAQWKGTMFHEEQEKAAYRSGELLNPFTGKVFKVIKSKKKYDNQSLCTNLYDLKDGCYLELLVFDPVHNICGQADIVYIETIDGVRYVSINDIKTNEEKPSKSSFGKLEAPLSHLGNNSHVKYQLQISLYAFLLERHGFVPKDLAFTHYTNYDPKTADLVPLSYSQKRVPNTIQSPQL